MSGGDNNPFTRLHRRSCMGTLPTLENTDVSIGQEVTVHTRGGETVTGTVDDMTLFGDRSAAVADAPNDRVYQLMISSNDEQYRVTFHPNQTVLIVTVNTRHGTEVVGNTRKVDRIDA